MKHLLSYRIASFAVFLALLVVVLGAYTRLTNAGLGCPDWPGCYGHLVVPNTSSVHIETTKAWTEMIHRYFASGLGLLILSLLLLAAKWRKNKNHPLFIPVCLSLLVIFQAALGMWTVTLKLLPVVVMGHLLGGLSILSLLWCLRLQLSGTQIRLEQKLRPFALFGLIILFLQIALGGWVSANYAGIACIGFPFCNGTLLPHMNFHEAFNMLSPIGVNYQGGVLDSQARVTIQMIHRMGAFITFFYLASLATWIMLKSKVTRLRWQALLIATLLVGQIILGILNVTELLPLPIAVAHNACAALLLLAVVTLNYYVADSITPAWRDYFELCKPKVVTLMLLTTLVGMFLATPGFVPWHIVLFGLLGIGLAAGSAAAINHVVDRHIDQLMARTQRRPIATGKIAPKQALLFASVLGLAGMFILIVFVNALTALLTFLTLIGYACVYTLYLKRATPQNIVIGGAAGAAPPLLGWAAVTNHIDPYALLLVLIIFTWTPPHFWALAIARYKEYAKANIPMLPVTHGIRFTKLSILLYSILLLVATMLPFATGMSHMLYLCGALILGLRFLYWAIKLMFSNDNSIAMKTFRYSIVYLMLLFILLLLDHYFILG